MKSKKWSQSLLSKNDKEQAKINKRLSKKLDRMLKLKEKWEAEGLFKIETFGVGILPVKPYDISLAQIFEDYLGKAEVNVRIKCREGCIQIERCK